jgi:regulator of nucleoside diphosphate kinase
MTERPIRITEIDAKRLKNVLENNRFEGREDRGDLDRLDYEIDRASIVKPTEIPADVVTMNSRVRLRDLDSGDAVVFSLVYPPSDSVHDAGSYGVTVSVLAPVGTAVLGYRAGDPIDWEMPSGVRRLKVEDVVYQPEAAGRYDL